ncbi:DUF2171 domain-containing protein [Sphingomonas sp.]|uniref:DUF2171 domain-containing protein n=1 Tax=Sphingomonas sp. TaxID=28214 RepID=UPI001821373F|nr:DUF2171 domain-containing protein [Sphingomonas sp.]MBA3512606.1 DUF2171 domain-containing protein [Sphingomonas sp.]
MAYDRYDTRRGPREQSRYSNERYPPREGGDRSGEERGFFERAGEQIASWFGDEDDDDRSRQHERISGRDQEHGRAMSRERERGRFGYDRDEDRGYRPAREREPWGAGDREDRGYRPVTGDYGRSEGYFAASGASRGDPEGGWDRGRSDRESNWGRDEYRRTSFAGSSERSQHHDPHYQQWRQRQLDELDRDYDEYRREHQSKFESDFGSWRERRQSKRQMLGQIRENMQVFGSDDEPIGTVERVAGDRIILAKGDSETSGDSAGGRHSLSCTEIDRVEGDRLILEIDAKEARNRWRDESRERALFEREDQGEAGPHSLERSFSGTYR